VKTAIFSWPPPEWVGQPEAALQSLETGEPSSDEGGALGRQINRFGQYIRSKPEKLLKDPGLEEAIVATPSRTSSLASAQELGAIPPYRSVILSMLSRQVWREAIRPMLKSIRSLFTQSGESAEETDLASNALLRQLWVSLIRLGTARGLTFPDAEDLAQESIVAGMQSFDPARGDFGAFCRTIMANKAKNLHRDTRPQDPIPEDGGTFVDPGAGPGWANYYRQCREKTDQMVADTVSSLDEEAADFFLVLAEVHADLSHGEVSEAARRLGVSPQKGWDIFRKIQRRFKDLDQTVLLPERPPEREDHVRYALGPAGTHPPAAAPPQLSDIPITDGQFLDHLRSRYRRYSADLGPSSRRQLQSLLRQ